ncbi:hypothetical protein D3C84_1125380 [compost metagenome]
MLMLHVMHISNGRIAKLTIPGEVSQIIFTDVLPACIRPNLAMLPSMATPTEGLAIKRIVLPRLPSPDIELMVYLQHNTV